MIKIFRFLVQVGILILLIGVLFYLDIRSKKQDYSSLISHAKPTIGTFESTGKMNTIFWTFTDGVYTGRIAENINFEGAIMGEQYHAIYDSTDYSTGEIDLMRPYLEHKVVDTTFAVEVLNFPLKANASSITYQYFVEGRKHRRKLRIRRDKTSNRYRLCKRWMVVYLLEDSRIGYLYPAE